MSRSSSISSERWDPTPFRGPSANPFYALASNFPPWTYTHKLEGGEETKKRECRGLWPLEGLCLALLLDEGTRSDVALVVFFAHCLKTANHILDVQVHTRQEVTLHLVQYGDRFSNEDDWEGDDLMAPTQQRRKSCAMNKYSAHIALNASDCDGLYIAGRALSDTIEPIDTSSLPEKRIFSPQVLQTEALWLLRAAACSESLDVTIIVFDSVVSHLSGIALHNYWDDTLLRFIGKQHPNRFAMLLAILLRSERFHRLLAKTVSWSTLWRMPSAKVAALAAKMLCWSPPDVLNEFEFSLSSFHIFCGNVKTCTFRTRIWLQKIPASSPFATKAELKRSTTASALWCCTLGLLSVGTTSQWYSTTLMQVK